VIIAAVPFRITPMRKPLAIRADLAAWAGLSAKGAPSGQLSPRASSSTHQRKRVATTQLSGMGASQGSLSDLLSLAGEDKNSLLQDVMLTYRGLVGHHEFFAELSRVVAALFADGSQRGASTERGKRSITSASLLLGAWIDHHAPALLTDHVLKVTVLDFLLGLGRPGNSFKVRLISRIHTAHERDEDRSLASRLLLSMREEEQQQREEAQEAALTASVSDGVSSATARSLSFFSPLLPRYSAGAMASTLTVFARRLFACINTEELLLMEGGSDVSSDTQPTLYACKVLFNRVSAWVSNELIAPCSGDSRSKALRTMLKVTRRLYALHNFMVLLAMLAELQGPASTQLKLAWATINKTARRTFIEHCKLMSPDRNWQLYVVLCLRERERERESVCVCMCVYVSACMFVRLCVRIYVCIFMCVYVCARACVCACMYVCVSMCTFVFCVHVYDVVRNEHALFHCACCTCIL
jgi:RasGEF domain